MVDSTPAGPEPASPATAAANAEAVRHLPFHDTRDFDDVRRGLRRRAEPNVVQNADGRVVWDNDVLRLPRGRRPSDRRTRACGARRRLNRNHGPVRGRRRHLPGAGPRPLEHHLRRGRHRRDRHRPADLDRDAPPPRSTSIARTAATVRSGGHLHPQPRRPLRRREGRGRRRTRWTPARPGHRPGGLPRARDGRERLRRHRRWRAAPATCTAPLLDRGPRGPGRRRARPDQLDRHGRR